LTPIDWIIIVVTLLFAVWGYGQGLIVGLCAVVGFAAGSVIGSRVGPLLLEGGTGSPYAPLFSLVGALVAGGLMATVLEFFGFRMRVHLSPRLGALDGLGGAALVACLALGIAWIAGALVLQTSAPQNLRRDVRGSEILQRLNASLPSAGPVVAALARFDPFPEIRGPEPRVRRPNAAIVREPEVRAARRSTVRVVGTACGLGVSGSGWVAADGVVVTNAHVVAGQDDTTVQLAGQGPRHDADAIWFDADNDLAILRTSGLSGVPPLPLAEAAEPGISGGILGFPQNGPFVIRPGRLGQTVTVRTQDAFGRGPVRRRITALRGPVRQGNSGGPMVDADGRVLTTIFAASLGGSERSGYGVPDSIVRRALARADERVSTGPCANG
jgi:S1-C subfamily serine protease